MNDVCPEAMQTFALKYLGLTLFLTPPASPAIGSALTPTPPLTLCLPAKDDKSRVTNKVLCNFLAGGVFLSDDFIQKNGSYAEILMVDNQGKRHALFLLWLDRAST